MVAVAGGTGCGRAAPERSELAAATPGGLRPLSTPLRGTADTGRIVTPSGILVVRGDSVPGTVAIPVNPLQWTQDLVLVRLRSGGLAPGAALAVRQPFLGPPGMRVLLAGGRAEVQTFIFGDPGAVGRAMVLLDTTRVAPLGTRIAWRMPASLVVNNNLLAIVLTRDPALRREIRDVLRGPSR